MTRVLTVGCELTPTSGSYTWQIEGAPTPGTGTITRDTSVKHASLSGTSSHAHSSGAGNSLSYTVLTWGNLGNQGYYCRFYFRVSALPSGTVRLAYLRNSGGPATISARLTATGKLQLYNEIGAAQIGSDSVATIEIDTWYRIELYATTGVGSVDASELRMALGNDTGTGTTVASESGASYTDNPLDGIWYGWLNAPGANKTIYIDDVAVNSSAGVINNSWAGHTEGCVYLYPASDNARTVWTAGAGGTTNLFEAVNNSPPAGVTPASATDTSQIKNTDTADTVGNYDANMTSYATVGLTSAHVVRLVQATLATGSGTLGGVTGVLRLLSNPDQGSDDSVVIGAAGALPDTYPTNWFTRVGTAINTPTVVLADQPVLRVGRRTAVASEAHVCAMIITVEYDNAPSQTLPRTIKTSRGTSW